MSNSKLGRGKHWQDLVMRKHLCILCQRNISTATQRASTSTSGSERTFFLVFRALGLTVTHCTQQNHFHIYFSSLILPYLLQNKTHMIIVKMPWSWHINITALCCAVLSLVLPRWFPQMFSLHGFVNVDSQNHNQFFWLLVVSRQIKMKTFLCTPALNSCIFWSFQV